MSSPPFNQLHYLNTCMGRVSLQVAGVGAQEALVLPALRVWARTLSYKFLAVRLAAAVPPVEALTFGSGGRTVKRLCWGDVLRVGRKPRFN
ncbi:hypothetical protein HPB47_025458 [Ixodes persulcatus]|uniref:Uncharacterized protein n=1 Tax=Ixodes persulcatus TaxID=34615 RepID=A0AC60Q381_IXOPE|nr:hypothetical protein HPB47_025458 [Ixodes persulcatus]